MERLRGEILSMEESNMNIKFTDIGDENKYLRDIDSKTYALHNENDCYIQCMDKSYPYLQQSRYQNIYCILYVFSFKII